ncbi:MAG: hypothetical protein A3E85_05000 [Gammaproteobacteria bacterium RIFCSPHIGHO2_12_FULL_45_12]|nr:MAG: hypothetical protein A3E85_05000 [Gammaproteobacteria bacterium RIFCSPHIGHO2_12_FULL_45_12]
MLIDLQPFPLKNAGRLPCFDAAQKPRFCLHQKGENRNLPLWNPPSRNVQRESLIDLLGFFINFFALSAIFMSKYNELNIKSDENK